MKRYAKRFFSLALVIAMCMSFVLPSAAADSTDRADKLNSLGLFKGTDAGYQLDQPSTRIQGIVMLIRLLGKENEALGETRSAPFTDVGWGKEYTSYAYNTGLTKGTGADTFTPNKQIKAIEYLTFLLRALGYSEEKGDFTWGTQLSLAYQLGMVNQTAVQHMANVDLDRGDMVDLSYAALTCAMKTGGKTLAEKLVSEGVFTRSQGVSAGVIGTNGWTYNYEVPKGPAIVHTKPKYGSLDVDLLTIDPSGVKIKAAMVNNTLGATASFKNIVNASGADVVVNANFFEAYESFKIPIGHVMVDGNFIYASSGLSSLGITKDGQLSIGRPAVFVGINDMSGKRLWAAYEVNTPYQGEYLATLYTPAFGNSITIKAPGGMMTVRNGAVSDYEYKGAGTTTAIPSDGYVVYFGNDAVSQSYFTKPVIGTR
ncbi:MAG: S-layer homology domain-containing protein, partial [Clostridia bacterium]|nr:S-layer homology domain-containing protein [Clostridia bacterium]